MAVFIIVPLALIVVFAFTTTVTVDADGNILTAEEITEVQDAFYEEYGEDADIAELGLSEKTVFTLQNILDVSKYMNTLLNSIWLALIATVICLVLAYPVAYFISRLHFTKQKMMLMLAMLPMWMNFLLRTYAWMTILERNGLLNRLFALVGLGPFEMINTQGAVVLGMVYNYLPFMILPLYSVMTKIDSRTIEAAQDLGANRLTVIGRVVLPLSVPGISSGITMVFVPAVSTFIISRMLGGGTNMLIGDLIDLQFLGNAYNPNLGAAMSLVLMVFILLCMSITNSIDNEETEVSML
ncbi:MAG: ABC transporter permease [Clostridia bacterium]|nr:ABC transporter permease [Clostridia bacterium]